MTNYPSGSKLNPFSVEIYHQDLNNHNWMGGWVGTRGDAAYYDRQNEERTCTGSHSAPYNADVYDELTENAMWIGGWVLEEDEDGEPFDFPTYFTATGTAYPGEDEEENVFGNEDYPIPIDVYEEMCELDIWTGGWVVYPNGTTEEVSENDGGGSGSGSGCGCGCGDDGESGGDGCGCGSGEDEGGSGCGGGEYVNMGSYDIIYRHEGKVRVALYWNSGYSGPMAHPPISYLSINAVCSDPYELVSNTLTASWSDACQVHIVGSFSYCHSNAVNILINVDVDTTYLVPG